MAEINCFKVGVLLEDACCAQDSELTDQLQGTIERLGALGVKINDQVKPVADLERAISRVDVIDVKSIASDEIKFGATIEIEDDDNGEVSLYRIVGDYESDIKNKKLSVSSPLARGLINKTVDDVVEINSPKGQKSYTIKSVKYI